MTATQSPLVAPPLTLHDLTAAGEPAWEAFVATCPAATFFHRAGWRRVIATSYHHRCHYRLARRGDAVVGVLPLVEVCSPLFGHALISTGFCVYGGIATADPEAALALAADAVALGRRLKVDHVELRHQTALPLAGWMVRSDLYASFRRSLAGDEASNLKAIPRKKRADVRKSMGNDLTVAIDDEPDRFYPIYAESVRNLGTPVYPRHFFEVLKNEFGNDVEISIVIGPGGPLAALVSFFFRDQVLPYYGGAGLAARPLHAYDYLYWTLIGRAVARGCRVFDFGRSKHGTGAFDYKTYWGFEPQPLHYQFHLIRAQTLPNVNPLNPKYRLMVAAWRRLPLAIANRLGPLISRQLG